MTHLFYGGVIAAAIAPARHRRTALLAGAALNTLPDLDVIPLALFADPITAMTWHRGPTHSWLVLPWIAWGIWAWYRRRGGFVSEAPQRWFWVILITLLAHPLIDAFTVYGTQLFWPWPMRPLMWSSLFIIDPLFLLPWLAAFIAAWCARDRQRGRHALTAGIVLGIGYLGWSLTAKSLVDHQAKRALAAMGLVDAPYFSVPTPFNTLLWRVAAMTPTGYVEGFRSLAADHGVMTFHGYPSNVEALAQARSLPVVQRLQWFNHGFMRAQIVGRQLVLSDLRMGQEPDYFFHFAVAQREEDTWRAIAPRQLRTHRDIGATWHATWQRIWMQPAYAAIGNAGEAPATSASK